MTPLRQRLIEELVLRGYSDKTKEAYVHAVAGLATHYGRAPDQLKDEETRAYLLRLHTQSGKAASTLNVAVSGLRFFYRFVLQREFYHIERAMPRVHKAKRRPKAYSQAEIKRLLTVGCVTLKHRAFLATVLLPSGSYTVSDLVEILRSAVEADDDILCQHEDREAILSRLAGCHTIPNVFSEFRRMTRDFAGNKSE